MLNYISIFWQQAIKKRTLGAYLNVYPIKNYFFVFSRLSTNILFYIIGIESLKVKCIKVHSTNLLFNSCVLMVLLLVLLFYVDMGVLSIQQLYNSFNYCNSIFSCFALVFGISLGVTLNRTMRFANAFKNFIMFSNALLFGGFVIQFYIFAVMSVACALDFGAHLIMLLAYIVGLVSLLTLNDRFWLRNRMHCLLFLYFPLIVKLLVMSTNMLEMFLYYELLLLPSIFFVYGTAYTRRSQQANIIFFVWTQLGSLIVLSGVAYTFAICGNLEFKYLLLTYFPKRESTILFTLFFIGFGVKVPLWPFHFWLTKVHVEAPSGFSIFLSGFLVKTAVYCFYKFSLFFYAHYLFLAFPLVCLLGGIDSSLKLWGQTDIKKLIAYATVQEMNIIFLFFNINDTSAVYGGFVFLFAHGILSSLMFYLVELVYKRTNSRSIYRVFGLAEWYPNLAIGVWIMLLLFFGFPGSLKFFAEFYFLFVLVDFDIILAVAVAFVVLFLAPIGFARLWFCVLYGTPSGGVPLMDLTKEESLVIAFLSCLSFLPCLLLGLN